MSQLHQAPSKRVLFTRVWNFKFDLLLVNNDRKNYCKKQNFFFFFCQICHVKDINLLHQSSEFVSVDSSLRCPTFRFLYYKGFLNDKFKNDASTCSSPKVIGLSTKIQKSYHLYRHLFLLICFIEWNIHNFFIIFKGICASSFIDKDWDEIDLN